MRCVAGRVYCVWTVRESNPATWEYKARSPNLDGPKSVVALPQRFRLVNLPR